MPSYCRLGNILAAVALLMRREASLRRLPSRTSLALYGLQNYLLVKTCELVKIFHCNCALTGSPS